MCDNWEKLKPIWRGSPSTACIENSVSYVSMDDEVDPFNEYRQEQYQEEEEGEMSDGVCSEAVVTTENDVTSEVSLYRQKHTVTKNVNATPKFVDNKRKNMEKGLSASQRDKIYMKMAKDELILKQTLVNQLTVATAESNKAFDKMSASIESVGKSTGEGIKLLACSMGNNQGSTGTPHPSTYPHSNYYPQQYPLPSGPTYSNGHHPHVPFTRTHSTLT